LVFPFQQLTFAVAASNVRIMAMESLGLTSMAVFPKYNRSTTPG